MRTRPPSRLVRALLRSEVLTWQVRRGMVLQLDDNVVNGMRRNRQFERSLVETDTPDLGEAPVEAR